MIYKPHVDNVHASGTWILGVSLGNTRILRLENVKDPADSYEIALPSGSVYLQRSVSIQSFICPCDRFEVGSTEILHVMIISIQSW